MTLAIFDLDNTLIAGDSDYLWGQFLVEQGAVNPQTFERANAHFYQLYKEGRLDIDEFLRFALAPLAEFEPSTLLSWRATFVQERIRPILLDAAHELVKQHRDAAHDLLVITATNAFVTTPIVELYGISNLIATEPEQVEGRFTGKYVGVPSFREGKVERLRAWLRDRGEDLRESWFYSDSHNDIPLLSLVAHPVAVDPDDTLRAWAVERNHPIVSLRS